MVGKYAYLVVTGTGDYSGTGISNYVEIVDLPLNQQRFSYYTNFHYDEPYNLTCYGKGENLDMYYIITEDSEKPAPKEMITMAHSGLPPRAKVSSPTVSIPTS